ncbi:MAG: hypothetical protein UT33_C0005G0113 [Candidatus Peregrinibacteria bacterium GW2011_GWC2_39_14]|nr:MAG: hypothetical protein US92_C0001G0113 [Candidatus Peregrinibacteria bacterium GW2011_GWA2_38_36]KKR07169.1 MAG: hypothetical protein UT33_C0005G0113 [Candidatus Peregrinibacteria bacterium GW2011_GWC2_39_14]
MTTQVSFVTDLDLKNQALEKAKREGITLKTLLIYAMKGFVAGKISLGIEVFEKEPEVEEIIFNDKDINAKAAKLAKLLK